MGIVRFHRPYDHVGHSDLENEKDLAKVKIEMTNNGVGSYCDQDDWVFLHYKAWLPDGTLVRDTKKSHMNIVFRLGHYEISKCWDIALQ